MARNRNSYHENDRLRTLIEEYPRLLGVISRFGISFGFGDMTVREACALDNVDADTFLAVCNFLTERPYNNYDLSLPALMGYLRKAHTHFLDFLLPAIRRKLIEAINCTDINDIAFLLLKFFDDYVAEVRNHMYHENNEIYTYVSKLLEGIVTADFRITDYSLNHGSMSEKLDKLKDIFIRHYHVRDNEILTSALMDIIDCGVELNNHCNIENRLFIPAVERLEKQLKIETELREDTTNAPSPERQLIDMMTDRERDVLRCVAKGMSNKEIAAELCLSIHTVTTYRRNISAKLQIHSAAGLTIFAILHNIIDIHEVSPSV
ncbi:MAG: LuxR C-terminal-related transcriptional regulator [Muribaculaceae bacterium]|nr:LuxR C-terminal-related transcriptional regulator [Muribaculaceae bacterium]